MPRLVVPPSLARQRIQDLITAGEILLAEDPAKTPKGKFREVEDIQTAKREIRNRTLEWQKICIASLTEIYEHCPISDYQLRVHSDSIYPHLDRLRGLLRSVPDDAQEEKAKTPTSLEADLHPEILLHCRTRFDTQHYDDAVFNAYKALEAALRAKIGAAPDSIGVNLVTEAMVSRPPSNRPKVRFSALDAEQQAFHSLFRGAIGAFKNPHSHRFLNSKQEEALELLRLASLLMRLLDSAVVDNLL